MSNDKEPCNCSQGISASTTLRMLYVTLGQLDSLAEGAWLLHPDDRQPVLSELEIGIEDCFALVTKELKKWDHFEGVDDVLRATLKEQ